MDSLPKSYQSFRNHQSNSVIFCRKRQWGVIYHLTYQVTVLGKAAAWELPDRVVAFGTRMQVIARDLPGKKPGNWYSNVTFPFLSYHLHGSLMVSIHTESGKKERPLVQPKDSASQNTELGQDRQQWGGDLKEQIEKTNKQKKTTKNKQKNFSN